MRGFPIALLFLVLCAAPALGVEPPQTVSARVADLGWITGSWIGQLGDRTLEETWSEPAAETMAALVRMIHNHETVLVEMLFIREERGTLVLHVQPWNPEQRADLPGYQKLVLTEFNEKRARFKGTVDGEGFRTLTYSSPAPNRFRIDVETQEGAFSVDLSPRVDTGR